MQPEHRRGVLQAKSSLEGGGGPDGTLRNEADVAGFLLLAPGARGSTWDVIRQGYGRDVETIDAAMAQVCAEYRTDPAHIAAAGFSDGASYALSLGLSNGKLFTHVIAFSP